MGNVRINKSSTARLSVNVPTLRGRYILEYMTAIESEKRFHHCFFGNKVSHFFVP